MRRVEKRPGFAFRPQCERLEAREVPAAYYWLGTVPGGNWSTVGNWTLDPVNKTPAQTIPFGFNDDVYFDGDVSNISVNGGSMSGYKSLHLVNGYSGSVGIGGMSVQTFELDSADATLDQIISTATLMVSSNFIWKDGTLNSTTNLATVEISGSTATALFAPNGAGTVYCGSNLTLSNGAHAEFQPGEIQFSNNPKITVGDNCSADVLPVTINSTVKYVGVKQINVVGTNALFSVGGPGTFDATGIPIYNSGGTVSIHGMATVKLGGQVTVNGQPVVASYYQDGTLPYLQLETGVDLQVTNPAWMMTGKTLTLYNSALPDNVAAQTAKITGDFDQTGGTVIICNPVGAWHYGTFLVTGKVDIFGGEYKPKIAGVTSGKNDIWESGGNFTLAMNNTATLTPQDNAGTNTVLNGIWTIIKSTAGTFTGTFATMNLVYFLGPPAGSFTWGTAGNPVNQANLST
jgi:hypothetical protein